MRVVRIPPRNLRFFVLAGCVGILGHGVVILLVRGVVIARRRVLHIVHVVFRDIAQKTVSEGEEWVPLVSNGELCASVRLEGLRWGTNTLQATT